MDELLRGPVSSPDQQRDLESLIEPGPDGVSARRLAFNKGFLSMLSKSMGFALRHWLLVANLVNGVIWVGALAVPMMMAAGLRELGTILFSAYQLICQQNPDHSYFLLGYQMAMDQRMIAIYGASVVAGMAFIPLRRQVRPLSWRLYLILILPMALDGFTQLFGWRHSNWELRTATGALFGAATVRLIYPILEAAISAGLSGDRAEAPGFRRRA